MDVVATIAALEAWPYFSEIVSAAPLAVLAIEMVTEERLKPKDTAAALATVVGSLFSTKVTQPTTPLMTGFAEQTRSEVAVQGAD